MMPKKVLLSLILGGMFFINTSPAFAHGDEDHSGGAKPVAVSSGGLPTAEAKSDDFELLVQLKGNTLQVYLDRYSDNAPVEKAQIEVESGTIKAQLKATVPGEYAVEVPALSGVGEHALVFTVIAGEQSDLLETTLKVAKPVLAEEHAPTPRTIGWWLAGGLAGIAALAFIVIRQRRSSDQSSGAKA
ncbi:hypothetical protein [Chitinibacter tainanensis]|uniref:hypothetical protein n=1 Tax=Chitinibacter tainanensis TaxID=230667 RepID=UPI002356AC1B|nr:hypothetical protein [Chitinibacter tainanensis]